VGQSHTAGQKQRKRQHSDDVDDMLSVSVPDSTTTMSPHIMSTDTGDNNW